MSFCLRWTAPGIQQWPFAAWQAGCLHPGTGRSTNIFPWEVYNFLLFSGFQMRAWWIVLGREAALLVDRVIVCVGQHAFQMAIRKIVWPSGLGVSPLTAEISLPAQAGCSCSLGTGGCCFHPGGFFLVWMEGGNFFYTLQFYDMLTFVGALTGYWEVLSLVPSWWDWLL